MPGPMHGRMPKGKKIENPGLVFKRLMGYVAKSYAPHLVIVAVLILISVLANVQGTMFIQRLIDDYIMPMLSADAPDFHPLAMAILRVAVFYAVGVAAAYAYNRIMINVTQGVLRNLRNDLFSHMETLPIKYFDTHSHGDIMSVYTNDTDTIRQMVSHCQCVYQHDHLKRAADACDACHDRGYVGDHQEDGRLKRTLFLTAAERSG